jgi:adenylosuccinate lyase
MMVYECAMRAIEQGLPFRHWLNTRCGSRLTAQEIDRYLDPIHYTGLAGQFVDRLTKSQVE